MYEVSREFEFSYTHRLWRYDGKCGNLHGHNGIVRVTLAQESLDESGLSVDFHQIKQTIESWVEENWDHKTILNSEDPLLPILTKAGVKCVSVDSNPTSEQFARLIYRQAKSMGLPVKSVDFWETSKSMARYCPDKADKPKRKDAKKASVNKSAVR
ncbi:MAG: 6-carboxytetrahydropterin synthase [Thermoguttaceae bacterium]|nr:6-carboxytetrahydropterin synthase [Thermoguttaceae bacterium]MBQ6617056.1 6-carboxytetrahydropterin synthase [Thermoguttaceae bacterium]